MKLPAAPLFLAGQTGSGKTAIALALARVLAPAEIINADAFQIYRGMETLTAAPSSLELTEVPHHLYAGFDPSFACDAAAFAQLAKSKIAEVGARALPLVVGGSGLYLKAITHGLAPTPKADPELREQLEARALDELISEYRKLDPEGAEKTNLKNRRYVTRNLEICLVTGKPASLVKRDWEKNHPDIRAVFLQREREDVYDRINLRTRRMFEDGVIAEVSELGPLSATAAKAIGLREIQAHLTGEMDFETCLATIQQLTRRYAKRQETWFKREPGFRKIPVGRDEDASTTASRILELFPEIRDRQ